MRDATRIVRSSLTPAKAGDPLHHGPVFAAPFHTPGDPAEAPYSYARSHNPTWTELEAAIAAIECSSEAAALGLRARAVLDGTAEDPAAAQPFQAKALVFASGMAAVAAVFGAALRPGDIAVLPADAYFAARTLMTEYFVQMGIKLRLAPTAGDGLAEALEGAKLLWLETPSNPTLDVCDIAALSRAAHKAGALVAVDNTTATPLGQSPLALGADFSVVSDTKLMTGHGDLLIGHVAVCEGAVDSNGASLYAKLDQWRTLTGGVLGPMEAWLALRSLGTLPLRMERTGANAMKIAEFLTGRPEVMQVMYPGMKSDPGHAIASRQMIGYGPVLSFVLKNRKVAESFFAHTKLITEATSFGGLTTSAERRARWGHDEVRAGLIRFSAGCEAAEDLIEDIEQALVKSAAGAA